MKKNTMMRIASVLLVAVLVTTCAISGTFAKYVSTANGTGSATVAAWNFTLGTDTKNIADTENKNFTFNLLETVKDTNGNGTEADVISSDGKPTKIAPGMWGYFDIVLNNKSDVNAFYTIDFGATVPDGMNVQFAKGTTSNTTLEGLTFDAINTIDITGENNTIAMTNGTVTVRVFWQWAYETGNDADAKKDANAAETALGVSAVNGSVVLAVTADITVTQAD